MIILTKDNGIVIPDYNDLANKPKINGVTLEGDLTSEELGIDLDTTKYYTKTQSDNRFQPKGNYLTSIPSEYVTENELNNTLTNKNYATKSEIPTIPTNVSAFNNDSGYITNSALNGYATETYVSDNYQVKGNYLTSVPTEYITETELNDAIAGLGGSDVPYVVMTTESATSTTLQYTGDLNGVINAVKNKTPYNAYFYNKATYYGVRYALYEVDFVYYNSTDDNGIFYVHSEGGGGQHRVNNLPFTFDGENYQLGNISYTVENYATVSQLDNKQDTLVSGTNIKTINGESILGEGNIEISGGTTDLSNYYTKSESDNKFQEKGDYLTSVPSEYITETELTNKGYATTTYVDTQIGDINTILENIIG